MKIMQNKGITLIALIITIIVMLILAGVTISIVLNGGLFTQAKEAVKQADVEQTRELILMELMSEMMAKGTDITETDVNAILEEYTSSGTATINNDKMTFTNLKTLNGNEFALDDVVLFNVGNGGTTEAEIVLGTVMFGTVTWNGGNASISLTTDSEYVIQWQKNSTSEEWTTGNTVTGLDHGDVVYARLWNGTAGGEHINESVIDNVPPQITDTDCVAEFTSIRLLVSVKDNEWGMPENPIYTFYSKLSGEPDSAYVEKQSGTAALGNITGLLSDTEYTIKVTVEDKAGNMGTYIRTVRTDYYYSSCFVAGTKVSTPNGLINIEELKAGDKVYSFNEQTGEIEIKEIVETIVNESDVIGKFTFENGEVMENTLEHPYYVVGKGWKEAKDLIIGDKILTQDKKEVTLIDMEITEGVDTKVYNFEVQDNHNYFVGNTMLLVHNSFAGNCGLEDYPVS